MASISRAASEVSSGTAGVGHRPTSDVCRQPSWEFFPPLSAARLLHGFSLRTNEIDRPPPIRDLGIHPNQVVGAEQPHGDAIAFVESTTPRLHLGVDGLLTECRGVALKIRVADCAAVYLFDPAVPAIGLVHSGRRGSEAGIVVKAIEGFRKRWSSPADRLILQISPCIRPPHYEVDFARQIREQARDLGVRSLFDCGTCTACHLDRYFSYRAEKGKTGRMWAVAMLPA